MIASMLLLVLAQDPTVFTRTLAPVELSREVRMPSTVLPWEEATLVAHVTGYVSHVAVREGEWVNQGDVLATIDVPLMAQDVASAEAAVLAAEAKVAEEKANVAARKSAVAMYTAARARAQAEVDWRRDEYERQKRLHERDAATDEEYQQAVGMLAIAEGRLGEAVASIDSARSSVTAAEARVTSAAAEVAVAAAYLDRLAGLEAYATIRCPFPRGLVVGRMVDAGALVEADATPLLRVMDIEKVRVRIEVDERDAVHIKRGSAVRLVPDATSVAPRNATITRVASALDPDMRRMGVEIDLDNADHTLLPGMFLHADLEIFRREGTLVIPAQSLRLEHDVPFVFVVEAGKVKKIQVTLGIDDGILVEVLSGLVAGAVVIVRGPESLVEGQTVRALEESGG